MTTQWVEGPPGPPGKIKNLTTDVIPRFYWSGDDCTHCSMHVTIDGSCLLQGADLTQLRRGKGPPMDVSAIGVLNFVAVWEAMYPLLVPEFGKRLGMMQYGGSMKEKSRKLFDALMTQANTTVGGVVQSYMDFGYEDLVADQAEYLGFRNLLVNLCHLMPVPLRCSRDSSHNEKPKHTGVEIRMFDVAAGEKAKQVLLLVQHSMEYVCTLPRGQDVRHVVVQESATLDMWLERLALDRAVFHAAVQSYKEFISVGLDSPDTLAPDVLAGLEFEDDFES